MAARERTSKQSAHETTPVHALKSSILEYVNGNLHARRTRSKIHQLHLSQCAWLFWTAMLNKKFTRARAVWLRHICNTVKNQLLFVHIKRKEQDEPSMTKPQSKPNSTHYLIYMQWHIYNHYPHSLNSLGTHAQFLYKTDVSYKHSQDTIFQRCIFWVFNLSLFMYIATTRGDLRLSPSDGPT